MLTNNTTGSVEDQDPNLFMTRKKRQLEANKQLLLHDLFRAVRLGNLYQETALILHKDTDGRIQTLEAQVLSATEKFAIIKGGMSIPIGRIQKVVV